jgi:hypothetical protein
MCIAEALMGPVLIVGNPGIEQWIVQASEAVVVAAVAFFNRPMILFLGVPLSNDMRAEVTAVGLVGSGKFKDASQNNHRTDIYLHLSVGGISLGVSFPGPRVFQS